MGGLVEPPWQAATTTVSAPVSVPIAMLWLRTAAIDDGFHFLSQALLQVTFRFTTFGRVTPTIQRVGAALIAAIGVGCSSGGTEPTSETTFLATSASFSDFCSWSQAPATTEADASDGLHGLGPLTVYWNHAPPHGATAFPVGTIIVKANDATDPTQRTIFAMVKRGGGFNSSGAVGWDWYSLQQTTAACDVELVLWSGPTPPNGETYANQPVGDCNGCHVQAGNDGVWDSALQLSNF